MIKKIKNNTEIQQNWVGQTININEYFEIEEHDLQKWICDSKVFQDISNGNLIINDGNQDFSNAISGWKYLTSKQEFGSMMLQASSESESTTTNQNYQIKVTLTTGQIPEGEYYISWNACVKTTWVKIEIDNEIQSEGYCESSSFPTFFTGFKYSNILSGTHNIILFFKAEPNKIAYIKNSRIIMWRIK